MPYLSLLICIDFKSVIAARTASATYETICKGAPQRKNCTAGVFWSKVGILFSLSYHHCHGGRRAARALSRPRGASVNDPSEIDDKARQQLFCWICIKCM